MVEVYGKKARQINAQDLSTDAHYTWVNAQCKEGKERSGGKERKKKNFQSQDLKPQPLEGKAPVCIATFTLHKDPCLQLLYEDIF